MKHLKLAIVLAFSALALVTGARAEPIVHSAGEAEAPLEAGDAEAARWEEELLVLVGERERPDNVVNLEAAS